jgi:hypothetical protein
MAEERLFLWYNDNSDMNEEDHYFYAVDDEDVAKRLLELLSCNFIQDHAPPPWMDFGMSLKGKMTWAVGALVEDEIEHIQNHLLRRGAERQLGEDYDPVEIARQVPEWFHSESYFDENDKRIIYAEFCDKWEEKITRKRATAMREGKEQMGRLLAQEQRYEAWRLTENVSSDTIRPAESIPAGPTPSIPQRAPTKTTSFDARATLDACGAYKTARDKYWQADKLEREYTPFSDEWMDASCESSSAQAEMQNKAIIICAAGKQAGIEVDAMEEMVCAPGNPEWWNDRDLRQLARVEFAAKTQIQIANAAVSPHLDTAQEPAPPPADETKIVKSDTIIETTAKPKKGTRLPRELEKERKANREIEGWKVISQMSNPTVEKVHKKMNISRGLVIQLEAWKKLQEKKREQKAPPRATQVSFSPKMQEAVGVDYHSENVDDQIDREEREERDKQLAELIPHDHLPRQSRPKMYSR